MEDYLLECLDVAVKAGDAPDKRRRKAMGPDAWNLLDRSWKGLLLVALNQEEGMAREASTRTSSRRMRNRGRRALNSNTDDWIEGVDGLVASHAPPGYRLSAMLVQRVRLGERWNPDWDIEIEKMRESCADGIHPVWPRLGQEAPILAEMAIYPIIEISTQIEIDSTEWIQAARFDPMERTALASWLEITPPFSLTAKLELAIQRMAKSFRAKGKIPKLSDSLNDLVGDAVLIRALARVCTQSDGAMDDLSTLSGGEGMIAAVAQDQLTLLKLRGGDESAWPDCHAADGDEPLAAAMRYQSWMNVPEDVLLAAVEIQEGLSILNEGGDTNVLLWNLVAAHLREGNIDNALENVASLNLIDQVRLGVIL
ncbi:MAG: hypothetical protein MKZ56_02290, partial [Candidatus Thalassarchaeum sp.]|nr:hypothetical protein [Candidatus Thalassarchaeum sp.]